MSGTARFLAQQQEQRRRQLVGHLCSSTFPTSDKRPCLNSADEQTSVQKQSHNAALDPSHKRSKPECFAAPADMAAAGTLPLSASQRRILAVLQRRHPIRMLLAGYGRCRSTCQLPGPHPSSPCWQRPLPWGVRGPQPQPQPLVLTPGAASGEHPRNDGGRGEGPSAPSAFPSTCLPEQYQADDPWVNVLTSWSAHDDGSGAGTAFRLGTEAPATARQHEQVLPLTSHEQYGADMETSWDCNDDRGPDGQGTPAAWGFRDDSAGGATQGSTDHMPWMAPAATTAPPSSHIPPGAVPDFLPNSRATAALCDKLAQLDRLLNNTRRGSAKGPAARAAAAKAAAAARPQGCDARPPVLAELNLLLLSEPELRAQLSTIRNAVRALVDDLLTKARAGGTSWLQVRAWAEHRVALADMELAMASAGAERVAILFRQEMVLAVVARLLERWDVRPGAALAYLCPLVHDWVDRGDEGEDSGDGVSDGGDGGGVSYTPFDDRWRLLMEMADDEDPLAEQAARLALHGFLLFMADMDCRLDPHAPALDPVECAAVALCWRLVRGHNRHKLRAWPPPSVGLLFSALHMGFLPRMSWYSNLYDGDGFGGVCVSGVGAWDGALLPPPSYNRFEPEALLNVLFRVAWQPDAVAAWAALARALAHGSDTSDLENELILAEVYYVHPTQQGHSIAAAMPTAPYGQQGLEEQHWRAMEEELEAMALSSKCDANGHRHLKIHGTVPPPLSSGQRQEADAQSPVVAGAQPHRNAPTASDDGALRHDAATKSTATAATAPSAGAAGAAANAAVGYTSPPLPLQALDLLGMVVQMCGMPDPGMSHSPGTHPAGAGAASPAAAEWQDEPELRGFNLGTAEQAMALFLCILEGNVAAERGPILFQPAGLMTPSEATLDCRTASGGPAAAAGAAEASGRTCLELLACRHLKLPCRDDVGYKWGWIRERIPFVTASNNLAATVKVVQDCLLRKRLMLMWVQCRGVEGLRRMLLALGMARQELLGAGQDLCFACVDVVRWINGGDAGGGGARPCSHSAARRTPQPPPRPPAVGAALSALTAGVAAVFDTQNPGCQDATAEAAVRNYLDAAWHAEQLLGLLSAPATNAGAVETDAAGSVREGVMLEFIVLECAPERPWELVRPEIPEHVRTAVQRRHNKLQREDALRRQGL